MISAENGAVRPKVKAGFGEEGVDVPEPSSGEEKGRTVYRAFVR